VSAPRDSIDTRERHVSGLTREITNCTVTLSARLGHTVDDGPNRDLAGRARVELDGVNDEYLWSAQAERPRWEDDWKRMTLVDAQGNPVEKPSFDEYRKEKESNIASLERIVNETTITNWLFSLKYPHAAVPFYMKLFLLPPIVYALLFGAGWTAGWVYRGFFSADSTGPKGHGR
jgi:hypothetical protein